MSSDDGKRIVVALSRLRAEDALAVLQQAENDPSERVRCFATMRASPAKRAGWPDGGRPDAKRATQAAPDGPPARDAT